MTKTVSAAMVSIEESAWTPISYPQAVWEETENRWISDAEVAEVSFVAFTGHRKAEHVTCRLVVRRVKRLQPLASDGTEQVELFAAYRHHGFITNSPLGLVEADERHRDHAIVAPTSSSANAPPKQKTAPSPDTEKVTSSSERAGRRSERLSSAAAAQRSW